MNTPSLHSPLLLNHANNHDICRRHPLCAQAMKRPQHAAGLASLNLPRLFALSQAGQSFQRFQKSVLYPDAILSEFEECPESECEESDCLESTCTCAVEQALGSHSDSNSQDSITILGIDPGLSTTGYGILRKQGGQTQILDFGALQLSAKASLSERIATFHSFFNDKIVKWQIKTIALETPFLGKNAQNFLKLGYLRGILYLLAQQHNTMLSEFAPREIKLTVTGYGAADKAQVARVITRLFQGLQMPEKLDITDALAVSLCALWRENSYYSTSRTL